MLVTGADAGEGNVGAVGKHGTPAATIEEFSNHHLAEITRRVMGGAELLMLQQKKTCFTFTVHMEHLVPLQLLRPYKYGLPPFVMLVNYHTLRPASSPGLPLNQGTNPFY